MLLTGPVCAATFYVTMKQVPNPAGRPDSHGETERVSGVGATCRTLAGPA